MGLAEDLIRAVEAEADDGLRLAAHAVLEEAKRNVPVGDPNLDPDAHIRLAESGHVEKTLHGYQIVFDAPYAAKQEFDLNLKHPRGGGPRYLERAILTLAPALERFVAQKVRGTHGIHLKDR
jgi:hypothetical protein